MVLGGDEGGIGNQEPAPQSALLSMAGHSHDHMSPTRKWMKGSADIC